MRLQKKELQRRYWAFALEYIKTAHGAEGAFRNVTTSKQYWNSSSIQNKKASVELVLNKTKRDLNKSAYDYLFARKDEIESKLGIQLNGWRFDGSTSYVDYTVEGIGINDEADWIRMAKFRAEWSKNSMTY